LEHDTVLTIEGLVVQRGAKRVVHGVDLALQAGQVVALLGPNGAGKSSLVLALAGALPIAAGKVLLDGRRLDGLSADAVRRAGVAVVPEGHQVLGALNVRDNLRAAATMLPRPQAERAVEAVLQILPELADRLDQSGRSLSGGQKQMVGVAQALIAQPKVLVIDELSLGLAPLVVRRLADVVQQVAARGTAVLLIEQFTSLALSIASSACVLQRGRCVWSGAAQQLQQQPDILHRSYLA
jgi:branched-chain amino acid transport system ATP-binding protein